MGRETGSAEAVANTKAGAMTMAGCIRSDRRPSPRELIISQASRLVGFGSITFIYYTFLLKEDDNLL